MARIRDNYPQETQAYIERIIQVRTQNRSVFSKLKTFEDVRKVFEADIPSMICQILRKRVTKSEALELSYGLDSYPVLRSSVHANLYLHLFASLTELNLA